MESLAKDATTATPMVAPKFISCTPESARAASSSGPEGMGNPACSANTHTNIRRYPCRATKCKVSFIHFGESWNLGRTPPRACKNKSFQRFALALSYFPFPKIFTQRFRISRIAQCNHADGLPIGWDRKTFPGRLRIKPGHLMHGEAQRRRLQRQIGTSLSYIVERIPVWISVLCELSMRESQN